MKNIYDAFSGYLDKNELEKILSSTTENDALVMQDINYLILQYSEHHMALDVTKGIFPNTVYELIVKNGGAIMAVFSSIMFVIFTHAGAEGNRDRLKAILMDTFSDRIKLIHGKSRGYIRSFSVKGYASYTPILIGEIDIIKALSELQYGNMKEV